MCEIQSLSESYEGNRFIQALIQHIPGDVGSPNDVKFAQTIGKIRRDRARAFFDELAKGDVVVNEALLRSEDFLHSFTLTIRCALNSRRREKIRMFARLLKNSLADSSPANVDEYEDFLNILDDLSYREIQALIILDGFSVVPRDDRDNDLIWTNKFWDKFESQLCRQLNILRQEVTGFMNRVARTGCYEMFTGTYYGYTGGKGKLTPIYRRLQERILTCDTDD